MFLRRARFVARHRRANAQMTRASVGTLIPSRICAYDLSKHSLEKFRRDVAMFTSAGKSIC